MFRTTRASPLATTFRRLQLHRKHASFTVTAVNVRYNPTCRFIEEVTENSSLLQNISGRHLREMISEALSLAKSVLLASISDSDSESAGQSDPSSASHAAAEGGVQDSAPSPGASRSPWPGAMLQQLHSNPGDYEWGLGDFDAHITQLLGEIENPGTPPAKEEDISSLPTVEILQEQTDTRLQCAVCLEEYTVSECVMKLPCLHYFHKACVLPWLCLHDSCPVCRQSLCGNDDLIPHTPVEETSDSQDSEAAEEAGDVRKEPTDQ